jgi:hypothetical protein
MANPINPNPVVAPIAADQDPLAPVPLSRQYTVDKYYGNPAVATAINYAGDINQVPIAELRQVTSLIQQQYSQVTQENPQ